MRLFTSTSKLCAGLILGGLLALGGTQAASAQTAQFTVQDQFGTSITVDTSSCTPSASFFPTFSISNGGSASFSATGSGSSMLCNVRYQSGIYGCQFQIQATSSGGGFAATNAYKGGSGRPSCSIVSQGSISGGYSATFKMQ